MLDHRQSIIDSAFRIRPTIGNAKWLFTNRHSVCNALPNSWTPVVDSSLQLRFGFFLKISGVEWRETSDLVLAMNWLAKVGIAEARRDPHASPDNLRSLIIRRSQQPIS